MFDEFWEFTARTNQGFHSRRVESGKRIITSNLPIKSGARGEMIMAELLGNSAAP
jgi:hypothetical protein